MLAGEIFTKYHIFIQEATVYGFLNVMPRNVEKSCLSVSSCVDYVVLGNAWNVKLWAIPAMHSPENALNPKNWAVSWSKKESLEAGKYKNRQTEFLVIHFFRKCLETPKFDLFLILRQNLENQ